MIIQFTKSFRKDYQSIPLSEQRAIDKALILFASNPRHPSLRAKKLPGSLVWYARATSACRFTFQFSQNGIILRRVGGHDILDKER